MDGEANKRSFILVDLFIFIIQRIVIVRSLTLKMEWLWISERGLAALLSLKTKNKYLYILVSLCESGIEKSEYFKTYLQRSQDNYNFTPLQENIQTIYLHVNVILKWRIVKTEKMHKIMIFWTSTAVSPPRRSLSMTNN